MSSSALGLAGNTTTLLPRGSSSIRPDVPVLQERGTDFNVRCLCIIKRTWAKHQPLGVVSGQQAAGTLLLTLTTCFGLNQFQKFTFFQKHLHFT